jgi:hypothetical protein
MEPGNRLMPKYSLILPVGEGTAPEVQCLEALAARIPAGLDCEILFVSAGPTTLPSCLSKTGGDRARLVVRPKSLSFAAACNEGAAFASGDFLVIADPALVVGPSWLAALINHASRQPGAAVIGSKVLYPNDTLRQGGIVIGQDRLPRPLYRGFALNHPAVNKSRRFQAVAVESALIQRKAFDQIRGFDVAFLTPTYAGADFCLRLAELGYTSHYCADSLLYDPRPNVPEGDARQAQDEALYRRRWESRVHPDDLQYYVEDGLVRLTYAPSYPLRLEVAAELATVAGGVAKAPTGRDEPAISQQVLELVRTTTRLALERQELEQVLTSRLDALASRLDLLAGGERGARPIPTNGRHSAEEPAEKASAAVAEVPAPAQPAASLLEIESTKANGQERYQRLVQKICEVVTSRVPRGARLLVVSRGDEELLRFDGREAWHFPRDEAGQYAGHHPSNSHEAIKHLEDLHAKGGGYLLFPSTSFWWLGYYRDFQQYLDTRFRRTFDDESCIIYQLDR